jgi:hypothetical protein|tara:strand:- start:262 stop:516 length:255 start_codon:yes stop_codon:yes gene_type:complete
MNRENVMTRPASETDFDYKDIDSMETALLVGAERIKYLPEPFEKEEGEKLTEIADWGLLLTKFVIEQARYTRYLLIRKVQEKDR